MQTREGSRARRVMPLLLSVALLGVCSLMAHAQTGQGSSSSQSGNGQSGQSGGSMSGTGGRMSGRQSRGGRMGGQSGGMSGRGGMGGSMGTMDDSSGFASLYAGLGPQYQPMLQQIFAENKDRIHPDEEDPITIDPAPWNYPAAAPGAIDVYHYTDYTHDHLAGGSVTDTRIDKMRIKHALEIQRARRALAVRRAMAGMSGSGGMSGGMSGSGSSMGGSR